MCFQCSQFNGIYSEIKNTPCPTMCLRFFEWARRHRRSSSALSLENEKMTEGEKRNIQGEKNVDDSVKKCYFD